VEKVVGRLGGGDSGEGGWEVGRGGQWRRWLGGWEGGTVEKVVGRLGGGWGWERVEGEGFSAENGRGVDSVQS
jgi:hypothetical protein